MGKLVIRALLPVVLLLALVTPATGLADSTSSCRSEQLAGAQRQVLHMLGEGSAPDLTSLEGEADLAALAALGYGFYDHQQASVRGMGWAVVDTAFGTPPNAGRPSVVFYAPSGENVTAPRDGFDFPYQLRGWAYAFPYRHLENPQQHKQPILGCLDSSEWFLHEQGIHTFSDGGFIPVRPRDDEPRGAKDSDCPGPECPESAPPDYSHGRLWDLHVWRAPGVPTVSMTNPGPKIPGIDPLIGKAFFYPHEG